MEDTLYLNTLHADNSALINLVRQTIEESAYLNTEQVGSHTISITETKGPHGWVEGHDKEYKDKTAHSFEVGDYAIDDIEPTPSPEVNTVEIVGLTNERANEFVVEETGKTVSEHKHNRYYPEDDLVVKGVYPNMGDPDKVWHFPESRLRKA